MSKLLSDRESYAKLQPVLLRDEIVRANMAIACAEFLLGGCRNKEEGRGYELEIVERYNFIRIAERAIAVEKKQRRKR